MTYQEISEYFRAARGGDPAARKERLYAALGYGSPRGETYGDMLRNYDIYGGRSPAQMSPGERRSYLLTQLQALRAQQGGPGIGPVPGKPVANANPVPEAGPQQVPRKPPLDLPSVSPIPEASPQVAFTQRPEYLFWHNQ